MHFSNKKSKCRYIPAFVFLIFIFGMALWFLFTPKSDYSSAEKRYLQQFPNTSLENISNGTFGEEFESYFADQFPMRNLWVGFNAYFSLYTGNNGASGVYNCKNDYLINVPVSTDNNIDKNFGAITKFKNSIDVPMTVIFAPSTGYIADDVLPDIHNQYNDDEYFDKAEKTLSQNGINFVDLRESFKEEYQNGTQLYYKTDHHWTISGAYTAYTKLCENLGITPTPKDSFDIKSYDGFYGTTYSTSGFLMTPADSIEIWDNPNNTENNIKVKITEGTQTKEYNSMFFYDHLENDDKYPVFIDGNHALTEITNSNAEGGTLVIIKDSFSHCVAPFLVDNYSKIILVDMRYYKLSVSALIEQENADQVVVLYGIDNIATDTNIVWLK
ncbi:MAG: hypothetical protein J1E85_06665 [Ruminococcus sp.]|nr:hypothetical protein [Ruminococcus sp.]